MIDLVYIEILIENAGYDLHPVLDLGSQTRTVGFQRWHLWYHRCPRKPTLSNTLVLLLAGEETTSPRMLHYRSRGEGGVDLRSDVTLPG